MQGVSLIVKLPDGTEETHITDCDGQVVIDDLEEPGLCEVRCEVEDSINEETAGFVRRE